MPPASSAAVIDTSAPLACARRPTPDRAVRAMLDLVAGLPPLAVRTMPPGSCHDRILAERVRADADIPARDSAGVDGFAFSRRTCRGDGPWCLRVIPRIAVARNPAAENAMFSPEAVRIAAGGPVPSQLDTVVRVDAVRAQGEHIFLDTLPDEDVTILRRGAHARCGDVIAQPDRLLDARDLAGLAMAGCSGVRVRRGLRVGILSSCTGKQDGHGGPARAMLMAALDRRWIARRDHGAVSGSALLRTLRAISAESDVVLALDPGGMADRIVAAGGQIVLDGIAMRPGGGAILATLDDAVILLVPEEPVAALTAMTILGWPVLRRRAGIRHSRMVPRAGIAAFTLPPGANPARYPLVRVAGAGEVPTLEMLSGTVDTISLLSGADGIACIAPDTGVGFGDRVAWVPVTDRFA